jgi:5-methylcytosine-specific restriction endonuclease McrA
MKTLYGTLEWRLTRARARSRDGSRCTVARLIGGACSPGPLHAHHIVPVSEGGAALDLDNVATTCAAHHPQWEALRRLLVRRLVLGDPEDGPARCPHTHRSAEARRQCEARMARRRQIAA